MAKKEQCNVGSLSGGVKYSPKERMHFHAKRSKVGAKDKQGNELSDFNRGREYQKAEDLGRTLGSYAIKKAAEEGKTAKVADLKAKRQVYKAKQAADRAAYKAKKIK